MALDRLILQSGKATDVSESVQEELTGLWNRASIQLSDVGGTADDITATIVPALTGGAIVVGMKFSFIAVANNTGPVTVSLNGGAATQVRDADGNPLSAGSVVIGRLYTLEAVTGGTLRLGGGGGVQGTFNRRFYKTSGVWSKPDGLVKLVVRVRAAGGGGGGIDQAASFASGGGGGGEAEVELLAEEVAASVIVTVGDGGVGASSAPNATAGTGGSSSFGAHAVATGGTGGRTPGSSLQPPGAGGEGTAGDFLYTGMPGGTSGATGASVTVLSGGWGGAAARGGFGRYLTLVSDTANAGRPNTGEGASGMYEEGSTNHSGVQGGSGLVEVEEYF